MEGQDSALPQQTRTLVALAEKILERARVVDGYIAQHDLPQPSFAADAPLEFFPGAGEAGADVPTEVREARRELREATGELHELATGAAESLRWKSTCYLEMAALRYIYHFKLDKAIPLDGELSFAEVAARTDTSAVNARRVLRLAMTMNLFREPRPGYVAHTAGSSLMHSRMPTLRSWVGFCSGESFRSSTKTVEAEEKWGGVSGERNQTPFNLAYDTQESMFEWFSRHPPRFAEFSATMSELAASEGHSVKHLFEAFDWNSLGEAKVVDVGGGLGHVSIALADKFEKLQFVVQDLPHNTKAGAESLQENLKDRVSFQAHDFFTPQPVHDADVYFLRMIFHDFSDKYTAQILQSLVPALKPGARILVSDMVIPPPGIVPKSDERIMRIMDCQMMNFLNSYERELGDWEAVFASADSRLKIKGVTCPPGSVMSLVELQLEG